MPNALIVEDEPEANKLLSMLVQLRGYHTDSAFTGGEALDKIERDPPDIVFLDLMLPDISGYDVCSALKTQKATALIPVVIVTARVAADNRIQSCCIGADQYVPKPYTPDQIFQAMADAGEWRRRVEEEGCTGEIQFESNDEGESLRHVAQLRSQLLAVTTIDVDTAYRVSESLRQLCSQADAWGQAHGERVVAALDYRIEPGRLVLTLRDIAGWFSDDPRPPAERWSGPVLVGQFEDVSAERPGGPVTLVVRLPDEKPTNGQAAH